MHVGWGCGESTVGASSKSAGEKQPRHVKRCMVEKSWTGRRSGCLLGVVVRENKNLERVVRLFYFHLNIYFENVV